MKRYEILSKEEIIKAYNSTLICADCILNSRCEEEKKSCNYHVSCNERMKKYLDEEIVNITHADEIRNMNDEELAIFLCDNTTCGHCKASHLCWSRHNGFEFWVKEGIHE